jgi:hypothetical protein
MAQALHLKRQNHEQDSENDDEARAPQDLKQLGAVSVARPQFLIECEELRPHSESKEDQWKKRLPHLIRLTAREQ